MTYIMTGSNKSNRGHQSFFNELKNQAPNNQHIELDFEEFKNLPLEDPLKICGVVSYSGLESI